MNSQFKEVSIIAYKTVDGVSRIQYKDYIIQTYGYNGGKLDLNLIHFIIDPNSQDVCEKNCLVDCIEHIDKLGKK